MRVEFSKVSKTFGRGRRQTVAVDNVSWQAAGGEVFGLLGPNGAGKTTMIRLMLDILRPDAGEIRIDDDTDGSRRSDFKRRLGYLPEERGLYKKRKVLEALCYFAALKGMSRRDAKRIGMAILERFELGHCAHKRIEDLSKGMSQKVQLASCILHDPEMVVLDEPFSGLDPVNMRLVRDVILELKARGKLIFLSTHMMAEVEALCDRIFMIHQGKQVLYGVLDEIKQNYSDHEVLVDGTLDAIALTCIDRVRSTPAGTLVRLREGKTFHDLLAELSATRQAIKTVTQATASIEDIFVTLVKGDALHHDPNRGAL